jgi:hypothetical protein
MVELVNYLARALVGKKSSREMLSKDQILRNQIEDRLDEFRQRLEQQSYNRVEKSVAHTPIFIFSAGWRSGSTLLQRMLMSNNSEMLIWGEPFDKSQLFDRMMNQLNCFTSDWPPQRFFLAENDANLSKTWIANLYPSVSNFLDSHRRYFDTLFAEPALKKGFLQWGVKEVRLTINHARYLKLLYPSAKFIFLVRNPNDAYASYRPSGEWYKEWPDKPVFTPYSFGRNWAELAGGFVNGYKSVGGFLVKYEDLAVDSKCSELSAYLGWRVPCSSDLEKVGSSQKTHARLWLPKLDRLLLRCALGGVQKQFNY